MPLTTTLIVELWRVRWITSTVWKLLMHHVCEQYVFDSSVWHYAAEHGWLVHDTTRSSRPGFWILQCVCCSLCDSLPPCNNWRCSWICKRDQHWNGALLHFESVTKDAVFPGVLGDGSRAWIGRSRIRNRQLNLNFCKQSGEIANFHFTGGTIQYFSLVETVNNPNQDDVPTQL